MFATLPFDGLMAMDVGLAGPQFSPMEEFLEKAGLSFPSSIEKHSLSPGIHTVLNPLAVAVAREPLDSARRSNVQAG